MTQGIQLRLGNPDGIGTNNERIGSLNLGDWKLCLYMLFCPTKVPITLYLVNSDKPIFSGVGFFEMFQRFFQFDLEFPDRIVSLIRSFMKSIEREFVEETLSQRVGSSFTWSVLRQSFMSCWNAQVADDLLSSQFKWNWNTTIIPPMRITLMFDFWLDDV